MALSIRKITGKKGEELREASIGLLLLAVLTLILFFFSFHLFDITRSKGDVESCRLSVAASGKISGVTAGIGALDVECPRKNIILSPDYYTVDDSEKKYISEAYDDDYAKNVKHVFAEEMRECWYKMGEGDVDLFDDDIVYGFDDICLVCSHIEFDKPVEENAGNLAIYIQETTIPLSIQSQEQLTYYDYLYRQYPAGECSPASSVDNIGITNNGEITTTQPYDILFKVHHYQFLGVDYQCNALLVGPTETIEQAECDYIYS